MVRNNQIKHRGLINRGPSRSVDVSRAFSRSVTVSDAVAVEPLERSADSLEAQNHGGGDPLEAPELQTRPAQQDRGPQRRRERGGADPEGGRGYHGQRGQVHVNTLKSALNCAS